MENYLLPKGYAEWLSTHIRSGREGGSTLALSDFCSPAPIERLTSTNWALILNADASNENTKS